MWQLICIAEITQFRILLTSTVRKDFVILIVDKKWKHQDVSQEDEGNFFMSLHNCNVYPNPGKHFIFIFVWREHAEVKETWSLNMEENCPLLINNRGQNYS